MGVTGYLEKRKSDKYTCHFYKSPKQGITYAPLVVLKLSKNSQPNKKVVPTFTKKVLHVTNMLF